MCKDEIRQNPIDSLFTYASLTKSPPDLPSWLLVCLAFIAANLLGKRALRDPHSSRLGARIASPKRCARVACAYG